jgi:SAM-dependent methyltransferase
MSKYHPGAPTYDHLAEVALAIPGPKSALDIPAGAGPLARRMKDKGYEVAAADICPEVFEQKDISCDKADLNGRFPYDDARFDLVVCREGIEHVENQFHTMREFHRVLKPGGWLVFSTPNLLSIRARLSFLLVGGRRLNDRPAAETYVQGGPAGHINLRSYLDLRLAVRHAGFRVDRVTTFSYSITSIFWFWLIPFIALFTWLAFRRGKNEAQEKSNAQSYDHVLSRDMLFGQKLIMVAQRE